MAALLLRCRLASRLVKPETLRCGLRALSSRLPPGGVQLTESQQRQDRMEEELEEKIWEKLHATPEPRLRSEVPLPPTTHRESWTSAALVSEQPAENVLNFSSRFYIDASGE